MLHAENDSPPLTFAPVGKLNCVDILGKSKNVKNTFYTALRGHINLF